jgi:hypothetical protein
VLFSKNLLAILPGIQPLLTPSRSLIANLSFPRDPDGQPWTTDRLQQILVDPEEHNDWVAEFEVDLALSRAANKPTLRLRIIEVL